MICPFSILELYSSVFTTNDKPCSSVLLIASSSDNPTILGTSTFLKLTANIIIINIIKITIKYLYLYI